MNQPGLKPDRMIYRSRVDAAEASAPCCCTVQGSFPQNATLWYGFGKDPYCNVRDADDMAVPVFQLNIAAAGAR